MHKSNPKISVIMGIYNCSETLHESISSIIDQSFTNWELIMCDDGSTDDTFSIAKKYADVFDNIIVLQNERNYGLAYSLDRKSTRLNSSHVSISYAVFCLKKKNGL